MTTISRQSAATASDPARPSPAQPSLVCLYPDVTLRVRVCVRMCE